MRIPFGFLLAISAMAFTGAVAMEVNDLGVITLSASTGSVEGDVLSLPFESPRWGMYSLTFDFEPGTEVTTRMADVVLSLQGKETKDTVILPGNALRLGERAGFLPRCYLSKSGPCVLQLTVPVYAGKVRQVILTPACEGTASLTSQEGILVLPADQATVFGRMLRYEPQPKKLCIGYWVNPKDFARWKATLEAPATYEVTLFQGCGAPHGGSAAEIVVRFGTFTKVLPFTVVETGGFQDFVPVKVGTVNLPDPRSMEGLQTPEPKLVVDVRAKDVAHKAVMDIQKVVLRKVTP